MNKIILKQLFLVLLLAGFLSSCKEQTIEPWNSESYIHFDGNFDSFYSFVYAGSKVVRDTINLRLNIAGNIESRDRYFEVKQVKTYGFVYEQDEYGNYIDSAFVELPNQAVPGVHYVDLNSYDVQQFVVPADSLYGTFNLVVLRDPSLKLADYSLTLEVQETSDFLQGYAARQKITLTLSDQVIQPKNWTAFMIGNTTVYSVMGYYGKVKHQLLIDVTGKKWNDDFITNELTEEYLVFYKNMAVMELERINAERALQGLHKLREDDSNPNSEIYFF
ncbi:MAG: DUF4843 domain-containing protein [Mangrovibacterium sp.]